MSLIDRQVNRARRRLTNNVFMDRLTLGLLLAAGVWALVIVVVRLFALGLPLWQAGGVAAAVAGLVGVVGTWLSRPSALQAAVALDEAAGLKTRLSTALVVRQTADPFARAAVNDAEKIAGSVHVPAHIVHRTPFLWPWSLATVATALLLAWLMPVVDLLAADQSEDERVPRAMVEAEHKAINIEYEKKINQLKEFAKGDPELEKLVEDLKPIDLPEQATVTPDDVRQKAAKQIDDVRDRLQNELERRDGDALDETKRMLQQLNEPGTESKAADQLSQSLATGDFEGAKKALEDLKNDIQEAAQGADTPEAKAKLQQAQKQLERLADQMIRLSDTVRLQKELENKAGLSKEDAKKLAEALSKMDPKQLEKELQKQLGDKGMSKQQQQELAKKIQKQQQAKKQCQDLAKALSKAAQACQQCQGGNSAGQNAPEQASSALSDAASMLSEMEMSEQMMNELESQLAELENMRENVCEGQMCPNAGQCPGPGQGGQGIGQQGPNYGHGLGANVGKEKVPYQREAKQAKTRIRGGTVIGRMLVEGPQVRGEASAEELTAARADVRDELDAVEREDVPRQYQKALRTYFERLAGLMHDQQQSTAGEGEQQPEGSADSDKADTP